MRRFQLNKTSSPTAKPSNEGIDTNLSIESMNIDQILKGRTVLSLEEEVEALANADELLNQTQQDVAETTRVEDVTDVMLNVADTVDGQAEVTPEQAMLIDTVSEMAVAGTDGNPDDVIESAEPLVDPALDAEAKALAVESFVEDVRKRAAEIWQKIRKFCIEIWNTIVSFFKQIFAAAPRLLARIKSLRDLITEAKKGSSQPKSAEIQVVVGTNAISYSDYQVRDAKELTKGLTELSNLAKWSFSTYLKDCKAMGEEVASELKKFDPKNAADHLKKVVQNVARNNFTHLPAMPATGFMGCFDVHATRVEKAKIADMSDAQVLGALRNSGVKLQYRAGRGATINTKNTFATMSFQDMEQTLKAVEGLVKQVIAHETSSDYKALEKVRADLLDGGNHAANVVGQLQGNDDDGKAERAYAVDVMKGLMNFNTTLTRWVSDLTMPLTKKIYQTSRTSLVLVENSVKMYGPKIPMVDGA